MIIKKWLEATNEIYVKLDQENEKDKRENNKPIEGYYLYIIHI